MGLDRRGRQYSTRENHTVSAPLKVLCLYFDCFAMLINLFWLFFRSLHESSDLFIFCGHGAGERMCDPFRLRRFASCPASLLWGCSSGALKAHGVHDALGTALYYLLAGAPFLVANLWDVTDKDIDKLCMAYMRSVFPSSEGEAPVDGTHRQQQQVPIAEALVQCRSVCRMANAVGSAPVLYGIPTLLVENAAV